MLQVKMDKGAAEQPVKLMVYEDIGPEIGPMGVHVLHVSDISKQQHIQKDQYVDDNDPRVDG